MEGSPPSLVAVSESGLEQQPNLPSEAVPYFCLLISRWLPLNLIDECSVLACISDQRSFRRTDSFFLSARDRSGLILMPGRSANRRLFERIDWTSLARVRVISSGRLRSSLYLPRRAVTRMLFAVTKGSIPDSSSPARSRSARCLRYLREPLSQSGIPMITRFDFLLSGQNCWALGTSLRGILAPLALVVVFPCSWRVC